MKYLLPFLITLIEYLAIKFYYKQKYQKDSKGSDTFKLKEDALMFYFRIGAIALFNAIGTYYIYIFPPFLDLGFTVIGFTIYIFTLIYFTVTLGKLSQKQYWLDSFLSQPKHALLQETYFNQNRVIERGKPETPTFLLYLYTDSDQYNLEDLDQYENKDQLLSFLNDRNIEIQKEVVDQKFNFKLFQSFSFWTTVLALFSIACLFYFNDRTKCEQLPPLTLEKTVITQVKRKKSYKKKYFVLSIYTQELPDLKFEILYRDFSSDTSYLKPFANSLAKGDTLCISVASDECLILKNCLKKKQKNVPFRDTYVEVLAVPRVYDKPIEFDSDLKPANFPFVIAMFSVFFSLMAIFKAVSDYKMGNK